MAFPIRILLGAGALLASSGMALAATATATSDLNVRTGPSTGYGVIDVLRPGETVRLVGCSGAWCEVSLGGETGFASRSYLDLDGGGSARVVVDDYDRGLVAGLTIGGYWEGRPYYARDGLYFYGGRWYGDRPGRPGWARSWRREIRQDWREDRREALQERREDRRERVEDRRERRDDRMDAVRESRRDARDQIENRRERRQDRTQAVRENRRETMRDNRREVRQEQRQGQRQEQRQERRERRGRDG